MGKDAVKVSDRGHPFTPSTGMDANGARSAQPWGEARRAVPDEGEREGPPLDRGIARSAGVVASFTLCSRILGLVRDSVIAAIFPRAATDAFFAAYTIPNAFRQLLAEGSLVSAFVPVFAGTRKQSEAQAREFFAKMLGVAILLVVLLCALGMGLAQWIVLAFAAGFRDQPGKFELAVWLTRGMFPYLLFVVVAAIQMGVLNTLGHFAAPAASPAALNLVIILSALWLTGLTTAAGWPPISSLAVGVLIGGGLQVTMGMGPLARRGYWVRPRLDFSDPQVRRVGRMMAPAIFGLVIYQVNVALSRLFASYLGEGPVSSLYYAQRLIELPLGLFAFSVATATLPHLAADAAEGDFQRFRETYRASLALTLFEVIPASLALAILPLPICAVLFQRGHFDWQATRDTADVLAAFSLGLWAAAGTRQTVPAFYALGDTRTPVRMATVGLLVYVACALALRGAMGAPGLALAVAISSTIQFLGLLFRLRARFGRLGLFALGASLLRALGASVVAVAGAWGICRFGDWQQGGRLSNVGILAVAVLVAVILYVVVSRLLKSQELGRLMGASRHTR